MPGSWQGDPALLAALLYNLGAPPDPESFDISPRRRKIAQVNAISVPANGSATLTGQIQLQDILQPKDGLLIDWMTAVVSPSDQSGHLQIVDTSLALFDNIQGAPPNPSIVPLAQPSVTTLFPRLATTLQFAPPPLLAFTDLDQWARQAPLNNQNLIGTQGLIMTLTVSLANNDAALHSVSMTWWVAYRKVSGLSGA